MKRPSREKIERDRESLLMDARPDDFERSQQVAAGLSKAEALHEIRQGIKQPLEVLYARLSNVIILMRSLRVFAAYGALKQIYEWVGEVIDDIDKQYEG